MNDYGHTAKLEALSLASQRLEVEIDRLTQSTWAERRQALDDRIAHRLAEHATASFGPVYGVYGLRYSRKHGENINTVDTGAVDGQQEAIA